MIAPPPQAPPITPLHIEPLGADPASGAARRTADAPPLVLLHGFTGDTTTWRPFAAAARRPAAGGETVVARDLVAVDLVGHGRSPDPPDDAAYALDAQAASVVAALDGAGVRRAVWLGYSMGGRVALTAALAAPERFAALVLVSTSPGLADAAARTARAAADAALAAEIARDGVAAFVERWAAHPLFASQAALGPAHAAAMRAQRARNRAPALAATLRAAGAGAMAPLWDRLGALTMPVLVVTGALDTAYGAIGAAMAAAIEASAGGARPAGGAAHVVVAGAGHAVHLEAPAALAAAVGGWLAGGDPRRGPPSAPAPGGGSGEIAPGAAGAIG